MTFEEYKDSVIKASNGVFTEGDDYDTGFVNYNRHRVDIIKFKAAAAMVLRKANELKIMVENCHDDGVHDITIEDSNIGYTIGIDALSPERTANEIHSMNNDIIVATAADCFTSVYSKAIESLNAKFSVMTDVTNFIKALDERTKLPSNAVLTNPNTDEKLSLEGLPARVVKTAKFIIDQVGFVSLTDAYNDAVKMIDIMDKTEASKCNSPEELLQLLEAISKMEVMVVDKSKCAFPELIKDLKDDHEALEESFDRYQRRFPGINALRALCIMTFEKYEERSEDLSNFAPLFVDTTRYYIDSMWATAALSVDDDAFIDATVNLAIIKAVINAYETITDTYPVESINRTFTSSWTGETIDTTYLPQSVIAIMRSIIKQNHDIGMEECRDMAIDLYNEMYGEETDYDV